MDAIHTQYLNPSTNIKIETLSFTSGELLLTSAKLMQMEWTVLGQLRSESIVDVVVELLTNQDPKLTYHVVLYICGQLQPSWSNVVQLLRYGCRSSNNCSIQLYCLSDYSASSRIPTCSSTFRTYFGLLFITILSS